MSFRGRLTLFFLLIVVLPMIALAVLLVDVIGGAREGKADARLSAGLETATTIYHQEIEQAARIGEQIGQDPALGSALSGGDPQAVQGAVDQLPVGSDVAAIVVRSETGGEVASTGSDEAVAVAELELEDGGRVLGTLVVSTATANDYLAEVQRLTGREAILRGRPGDFATEELAPGTDTPSAGDAATVEVGGEEMRAASIGLPPPGGLTLTLFGRIDSEPGGFSSSPLIAAALVGFMGIAVLFVVLLLRTLGGQVSTMLEAARRIGSGDFSQKVPVIGHDEMAGLADEFNKMSDRLSEQMHQLRRQQVEIDRSVRRIGEASAAGLDREALLEILAETAVGACDAEYGLISLSGREGAQAEVGRASEALRDAVLASETRATSTGELSEDGRPGAYSLSGPLRRIGEPPVILGVITVARRSKRFNTAERDVFLYLIGQAAASIENVALHEQVSEQAITDDLTGLANKRAFDDQAEKEAARAERFGHPLSLLMLDIDDFKLVNDTHGHLQGDEVLRRVSAILGDESRGVDEPARYGGEEFVVVLPETDSDGAVELAERVRMRIESESIPLVERDGRLGAARSGSGLRVTASVGVASMPGAAHDLETLIAAADGALYAAKRAGKNRVARAAGGPDGANGGRAPGSVPAAEA